MDSKEKEINIKQILEKLKTIYDKYIKEGDLNKALKTISLSASLQYEINQWYVDLDIEQKLMQISRDIVDVSSDYGEHVNSNTVLFYDGFGLDLRGLAITYTRAIAKEGFELVYVIPQNKKKDIPTILKELSGYNVVVVELEGNDILSKINKLNRIFEQYKPQTAFFYSGPEDIEGNVVFYAYDGNVKRFHIDLTDHAFWIGISACDYIIDSREMGASIAIYERGIKRKQIQRLDALVYINKSVDDESLPFDIESEKYFFSGGALYKTLGDKDLLFYKAVRHILNNYSDLKFLYAGFGDSSEIKKLMESFPNRVFLIPERRDFFRLIENSLFYLNTYPMFGGMMMRYAAAARKLPMTLRHDNDSDGLLFNQEKLGIEFDEYESFIEEIDRILSDSEYRSQKEAMVYDSILNEDAFNSNVRNLIIHNETEYYFGDIPKLDTTKFRSEYLSRFRYPEDLVKLLCSNKSAFLARYFPLLFMRKILKRY